MGARAGRLPAHDVRDGVRALRVDEVIAKTLDVLPILHADHEQNRSTSTVRVVGSSQTNLFASISAGMSPLAGSAAPGLLRSIAHG
jgi:citrate synthase